MANEFFTAGSVPVNGAPGSAATIRTEFAQIVAAFDKLPVLAGNAGELVVVNGTGTALETSSFTTAAILTTTNTQTITNKTLSWSGNVWTGFGTAATKNAGTGADNVLLLAEANKLPALNGSNLTGISLVGGGTGASTLAGAQAALGIDLKAPITDASLAGIPIAPTPAPADSSARIATTRFVADALVSFSVAASTLTASNTAPLVNGAATAGVSGAVSRGDHVHPTDTALMPKAGGTFTGAVSGVTATAGDNTTKLATTAFVAAVVLPIAQVTGLQTALDAKLASPISIADVTSLQTSLDAKAPHASPTLTGTVTIPTVAGSIDSTTKAASTAFVQAVVASISTGAFVSNVLPLMDGAVSAGVSPDASRVDHRHPSDTTKLDTTAGAVLTANLADLNVTTGKLADLGVSTAKIADAAVTYAKLQDVSATDRLLGRVTAGAGDAEELVCTPFARSLLDDADAATARATLNAAALTTNTFTGAQIGALTALVSAAAALPINLATNCNFTYLTAESSTLALPTNPVAGQSGIIVITQGATARLLAYNAFWKFPEGKIPTLTATAGAVDTFAYYVESATRATCRLIKGVV